jgi:hypothetical protein
MAITVIKKIDNKKSVILMFRTIKTTVETETEGIKKVILGTVVVADETLKALSDAVKIEISRTEEEYHTELRRLAAKANQLITSHSTNPEWNPGEYKKHIKDGNK